MAAKDKFKSVAATFQIFKDGEAVSARKLDGIIRKIQAGADKIQQSLGDLGNYALTFDGLPLFHNSIARSLGPADHLSTVSLRVIDIPQKLNSRNQGFARFPYSADTAIDIGNKSQNLLPIIGQVDKIGIGCIADDGSQCVRRFDTIYNSEKNILDNGLFDLQLSGWQTSGVLFDGTYAHMGLATRYNTLPYSENFEQWTNVSGTVTSRAFDNPNSNSSAMAFAATLDGSTPVNLTLDGSVITTSSKDWCFSVYMASSGSNIKAFLEIDEATHKRHTQGRGGISEDKSIYAVNVSGTTWNRYYVYGQFASARTSGVARIHLRKNSITKASDTLYIWGAQLEPTLSPSTYRASDGTAITGYVGETFFGQTFDTIPKKWYQVSVDFNQVMNNSRIVGGSTYSLFQNQKALITASSGLTLRKTFQANTDQTNIYLTTSGLTNSTISLKNFRVDPGIPCHALNCPGFSAYEKNRQYRATLPTITDTNHQYFGTQLKFPDEVSLATNPDLPDNIIGIFDHEQNHVVPQRIVSWSLANWPIGDDTPETLVTDSDFLTDWTTDVITSGTLTYPTALSPTGNSGSLTQANVPGGTNILAYTIEPDGPEVIKNLALWLRADDLGYSNGGEVETWTSREGSSFAFVKGTTGPTYRTNLSGINFHNAVIKEQDDTFDRSLTTASSPPTVGITAGTNALLFVWRTNTGQPRNADLLLGSVNQLAQHQGFYVPGVGLVGSNDSPHAAFRDGNTGVSGIISQNPLPASAVPNSGTWHQCMFYKDVNNNWRFWMDGTEYSQSPTVISGMTIQIDSLFEQNDGGGDFTYSDINVGIAEVIIYDENSSNSTIEVNDALGVYNTVAEYYGMSKANNATKDTDALVICAVSGNFRGITKTISIPNNTIATIEYNIKANMAYSGIREIYTISAGSASLDLSLNSIYSGINISQTNDYRVSGTSLPGDTNAWADSSIGGGWDITRRIKATSDGTLVKFDLGVIGNNPASTVCATLDRLDILTNETDSSRFKYSNDPILGLNWDGQGTYVRNENLFKFSNDLTLWNTTGLTISPSANVSVASRFVGNSGSIFQTISGVDLLDNTFTLSFVSQGINQSLTGSGLVTITQGANAQTFNWIIPASEASGIIVFSGIEHEIGPDMEVRWTIFGDQANLSKPHLVHGSGVVDYIETSEESIKKYRRAIQPRYKSTVDTSWAPGYALVEGGMLFTTQSGVLYTDGGSWGATESRGFPSNGVIRVEDQEYAYRLKQSGLFVDTIGAWRGTTFNPLAVTTGANIVNIPLPRPITNIHTTTKEITFKDVIPAPLGDWDTTVNLQIYNTHISNFNRFSLQSSAVSVTRATGNLLTSFIQHVADHKRHFRASQLCSYIIDGSSWAASPVIRAQIEVVDGTIEELTEQVQINITALRFVPTSSKEIIVEWGDGNVTTVTGASNTFNSISHIYDLKQNAGPTAYTIKVVIKDLDLDFSRQTTTSIIVSPKLNPSNQPTKSTVKSAAKMLIQDTLITMAGARIKDQNSFITTAGANMVIP